MIPESPLTMNLLKIALEDVAKVDETRVRKEHTVIMQGPLSTVFAKALNLAYSKTDPVSGQPAVDEAIPETDLVPTLPGGVIAPAGVTPVIAQESGGSPAFMQMAEAVAAKEREAKKLAQAEGNIGAVDADELPINIVYPFGTHAQGDSHPEEDVVDVMSVVNELKDTPLPHEMVFVEGAMSPSDDSPLGGQSMVVVHQGLKMAVEGYQVVVKLRRIQD